MQLPKSRALKNETFVPLPMRCSTESIVEYDTWFNDKVEAARADMRPAVTLGEWDAIRAQKLKQWQALSLIEN